MALQPKRVKYLCSMDKAPRILLLHYVLIAYVTLQFVWWAWLIYDLNVEIIELRALIAGETVASDDIKRKLWMILGEGSVFFTLLGIGAWYIRKFVLREHRLARQERNFLLATTHEFNSPIAAVKLNLQTLQRKELNPEQRETMVQGALQATTRLQSLVGNVLMASRIDAGKYQLHREPVDLGRLLQRLTGSLQPLIAEAGNTLELDVQVSESVNIDPSSFEFVISNLVVNAIKYAPGTIISLSVHEMDGVLHIVVSDHGPGIPEQERERVFTKFYRMGSEDTRAKKGTGLGLYLVKELIDLQGGKIQVMATSERGGATFKFQLPYGKQ